MALGSGEDRQEEYRIIGVKTVSLASALRARISKNKPTNKAKVRQINGKVYLEKL